MLSVIKKIFPVFSVLTLFSFCTNPSLPTVESVTIEEFMGTWYEIASLPTTYNKGCNCSKVDMELAEGNEYVRMINSCMKKNKQGAVLAKAFLNKKSGNTKMRVQLFWPFRSDYYIIMLAEDYSYAMVGNPDRSVLQFLSRNKSLDDKIFQEMKTKAAGFGFDTSLLIITEQNCE